MTTAKKIFSLIACLALVLTSAGVCFADSFTDLFTVGNNSTTLSFPSDGVVSVSSTTRYQPIAKLACSSVHCIVSFSSNRDFSADATIFSAEDGSPITFIDGENVYLNNSNKIVADGSVSSGWAEFSFSTISDVSTYLRLFGVNMGSNPSQVLNECTFTFVELTVDNNPVISQWVAGLDSDSIPPGYALRIYSDSSLMLGSVSLSYDSTWNFPVSNGSSIRQNGAYKGIVLNESIIQGGDADRVIQINWTPLNANLFGRASKYSAEYTNIELVPGQSFVITNPSYGGTYKQSDGSDLHQNTPLYFTINYSHQGTVYYDLVPLFATLSYNEGIFTYSNTYDLSSGVIHGTIVPGSGSDPGSVDFGNPPDNGGNADEPPLSENTTIFGLLNTLVNYFTGFFDSAVNAIQSLVSTGSVFMQSIVTMFSWLPVELTTIIFSAFVILLVVGVLKLLWR